MTDLIHMHREYCEKERRESVDVSRAITAAKILIRVLGACAAAAAWLSFMIIVGG